MLRLMKVFTRGVFSLAPFWWGWLGVLMLVNIALPLLYLSSTEARVVLGAVSIGMVIQLTIISRYGFVRLLGLGHSLWLAMLPWLAVQLSGHGIGDGFGKWLVAVLVIDSISVVLDVADVVRWFRGDRTPSVTLADV